METQADKAIASLDEWAKALNDPTDKALVNNVLNEARLAADIIKTDQVKTVKNKSPKKRSLNLD